MIFAYTDAAPIVCAHSTRRLSNLFIQSIVMNAAITI